MVPVPPLYLPHSRPAGHSGVAKPNNRKVVKETTHMKLIAIRVAIALSLFMAAGSISSTPKPAPADFPFPTCGPCPPVTGAIS